jgi:NTE family protein
VGINFNLKYALVLAGGGARGLVHIGALCALEEAGFPRPSLVAGCSMGAIVGGLYAMGMAPAELKKFVEEELSLSDFMESPGFKMNGPIAKIILGGQFVGNFASKPGIDPGDKVVKLLERFAKDKTVEGCAIPFVCNAVDLVSGSQVILNSGNLVRAIRASMSFPGFFEPLVEGGRALVDGGVADNMPVRAAYEEGKKYGIERVLAINTHSDWHEVDAANLKNGFSVVMRCIDVLRHNLESGGCAADLEMRAADKSSVFDFDRKKELVALGTAAVQKSMGELETFFGTGLGAYFARKNFPTAA